MRPITAVSPKELAHQQAVGGMRHPSRAIARLTCLRDWASDLRSTAGHHQTARCSAGVPVGPWVQSRGCWSYPRQYQGCGGTIGWCDVNRSVAIRSSQLHTVRRGFHATPTPKWCLGCRRSTRRGTFSITPCRWAFSLSAPILTQGNCVPEPTNCVFN